MKIRNKNTNKNINQQTKPNLPPPKKQKNKSKRTKTNPHPPKNQIKQTANKLTKKNL